MRKYICLFLLFIILLSILSGCAKTEKQKDDEISELIFQGKKEEAEQKVVEYYKNNEKKAVSWLMLIDAFDEVDYKDKLVIEKGWTWEKDGNFTYIKGRVKNTSDKGIRYFKITARYRDENKQVLDTDYTNSGELIRPGDCKEFEIMHRYNPDYKYVSLSVDKVSLN